MIEDTIDLLIKKAEYKLTEAEAIFAEVLKTLVNNGFDKKEWDEDIANRFAKWNSKNWIYTNNWNKNNFSIKSRILKKSHNFEEQLTEK